MADNNAARAAATMKDPTNAPSTVVGARMQINLTPEQASQLGMNGVTRVLYSPTQGNFIAEGVQAHGRSSYTVPAQQLQQIAQVTGKPEILDVPIRDIETMKALENSPEYLAERSRIASEIDPNIWKTNPDQGHVILSEKLTPFIDNFLIQQGKAPYTSASGKQFQSFDPNTLQATELPSFSEFDQSAGIGSKNPQVLGSSVSVRRITQNEIMDAIESDPTLASRGATFSNQLAKQYYQNPESVPSQFRDSLTTALTNTFGELSPDGRGVVTSRMTPPTDAKGNMLFRESETGQRISGTPQTPEEQARFDQEQSRQLSQEEVSKRRQDASNIVNEALKNGLITPGAARAITRFAQTMDPNNGFDLNNVVIDFQRINSESLDPQLRYESASIVQQLQSQLSQLNQDRSAQQEIEGINANEAIRNTQADLEARGRTFSGEGTRLLGAKSALGAPQGQEGLVNTQNRLSSTASTNAYNRSLENIRRLAEQKLGSDEAQKIGFSPLIGGFEGEQNIRKEQLQYGVLQNAISNENERVAASKPLQTDLTQLFNS